MWPKLFALYFPSFNGCKGWKLQKGTQSLGQPNYLAVTIEYRNCRLIRTWSKVKVALWNPNGLYSPWNSPGQNAGLGSLSLLQGIFPAQELNPGLPHSRQILYQLSHQESPGMLEWVAYPFSSESSLPRNRIGSPALQVDSLPTELSEKPKFCLIDLF